jgi:hypothetical protein
MVKKVFCQILRKKLYFRAVQLLIYRIERRFLLNEMNELLIKDLILFTNYLKR